MTVKELKDNLNYYDDDAEIEFTYVEIDKKLDICFIGSTHGTPWIDMEVKDNNG